MKVYKHNILRTDSRLARRAEDDLAQAILEKFAGLSQWAELTRSAIMVHAVHDNPVMLEGEQGTGKEYIARMIHKCSPRAEGPFVAVSCHQVSPESIEAALFGSVRALASGRSHTQAGLVESSDGGTIYINGVSGFTPLLQEKIARLIAYREFKRQGDDCLDSADVRVILGSDQAPEAAFRASFPLDGRGLSVSDKITVLPLRERPEDIEPLSRHFVKEFCRQMGKEPREITPDTLAVLRGHNWPGNVAELKSVIHHVVQQLVPPPIDLSLLPSHLVTPPELGSHSIPESGIDLCEEVKQVEISLLCAALKRCHGVQYKAAQLLGVKPTTLNTKLTRYGIDVDAFK